MASPHPSPPPTTGVSSLCTLTRRPWQLQLVHIAKTGGTALERQVGRMAATTRCLTRHNRSSQTGTHCLSNYIRTSRHNTLTMCVLRDPVNRTLSAFNGNPHLPCLPRLIDRWFADQSYHGTNNNEDIDQVAYLPFCDIQLCFERLQSDFDALMSALPRSFGRPGNPRRLPRMNTADAKSKEDPMRRDKPCVSVPRATAEALRHRYASDVVAHAAACVTPSNVSGQVAAALVRLCTPGAHTLTVERQRAFLEKWSASHAGWGVRKYVGPRKSPWTNAELVAHPAATGRAPPPEFLE